MSRTALTALPYSGLFRGTTRMAFSSCPTRLHPTKGPRRSGPVVCLAVLPSPCCASNTSLARGARLSASSTLRRATAVPTRRNEISSRRSWRSMMVVMMGKSYSKPSRRPRQCPSCLSAMLGFGSSPIDLPSPRSWILLFRNWLTS